MPLLLAETDPISGWLVVVAIGAVISVLVNILTFLRMTNGTDAQRQVEPTPNHAVMTELRGQTTTLNAINREMGEVKTSVGELSAQTVGIHTRVGAISRDLAATVARVDGLERREGNTGA